MYDETFRSKAVSRVGSFRANTTPEDQIRKNMRQLVTELGITSETVIHRISGITTKEFIAFLKDTCTVLQVELMGELTAGLCAAGIFGDGIQVLSGTGSNSAAWYQGKVYFAGGYGSNVADIGSGYWIGREAMIAAIADFEGYGPRTILTDLLAAHLGGDRASFREAVYSIYQKNMASICSQVAACSQVVSRAAERDDPVAVRILQTAGKQMADQTVALIKKHQIPDNLPLTVSGNVWRSHHVYMSSFVDAMLAQYPECRIVLPKFEPIIGVIIKHYYYIYGDFSLEMQTYFKTLYPQYQMELPCVLGNSMERITTHNRRNYHVNEPIPSSRG